MLQLRLDVSALARQRSVVAHVIVAGDDRFEELALEPLRVFVEGRREADRVLVDASPHVERGRRGGDPIEESFEPCLGFRQGHEVEVWHNDDFTG